MRAGWVTCVLLMYHSLAQHTHGLPTENGFNAVYEDWQSGMWKPMWEAINVSGYPYRFNDFNKELCQENQNTSKAACWEAQGEYQQSIILDTGSHQGRMLYLNCEAQSSEADEFIYHEMLVQAAMLAHPNPKTVLIAGGGEGGTAREVLKHNTVEKLIMVDLDKDLVRISEELLPYWRGVKADPRFELHVGDAVAWMNTTDMQYDVIIFDLPDFVKGTEFLYELPVFQLAKSRLRDEHGMVATHSGGNVCNSPDHIDCRYIPILLNTYRHVFGEASLLMSPLPSWDILHGFIVGTAGKPVHKFTPEEVDERVRSRTEGSSFGNLRFYNKTTHQLVTKLPKPYQQFLALEKDIMDRAVGRKAPVSNPTDWKSCSCDQTHCERLDEDEDEDEAEAEQQEEEEEEEEEDPEEEEEEVAEEDEGGFVGAPRGEL